VLRSASVGKLLPHIIDEGEAMRYGLVLMLSTLTLIACEPEAQLVDRVPPTAGIMPVPEIRDSAGVRIVEHGSLAGIDTTSWHVAMDDTVRIGRTDSHDHERDSPYQFGLPVGIERFASGSVAVADQHASQVRVFDADGRFEQSIGRRGEGPGEFTWITGVHAIRGDSFVVVDQSYRWSVFDETGAHVRSHRLAPEGVTYPTIREVFADGTLLVRHRNRRAEAPSHPWGAEQRGTTDYSRFGSDGAFISSFGTFPLPIRLQVRLDSPPSPGALPFAALTPLASPSRPSVAGTRFYWAAAGFGEVHVFDTEDMHQLIVRFGGTPLGGASRDCPTHSTTPEFMSREVIARFCELRRELGEPTFSRLLVDDLGNMWLREPWPGPEDPDRWRRWYVFDPEGMVVARVSLPSAWGIGPVRIGRDYVLALERDELGVETVVLVPLVKR
jgi:hypothetical protein